jgi:hypothetical protein
MKKITSETLLFAFLILITAFFLLQVRSFSNPLNINPYTTQPENAVTFPTSGTILKLGKTYTIKWKATPGYTDVFLINHAYESAGVSVSIADRVYNIPDNGSLQYTVPKNIPTGEYKFTIGNLNSEYFEIEK